MIEPSSKRSGQRGYILALLLGVITVMGIFLTRAMPSVITEVQRDQEDELIFRGEAIRTAIIRYKNIRGQYPISLEELTKVRPAIIRQLYKDPMTADGEWTLVTAVQPGASGDMTGLPIIGVRSKSQKDSFKIYNGKTIYSDWVFSAVGNLYGMPGGLPNLGNLGDASSASQSGSTDSSSTATATVIK